MRAVAMAWRAGPVAFANYKARVSWNRLSNVLVVVAMTSHLLG